MQPELKNNLLKTCLVIFLVLLTSACGMVAEKTEPRQTETAISPESQHAKALAEAGNFTDAAREYITLAKNAAPPLQQEYLLSAVSAYLDAGLLPEAQKLSQGIKPETLNNSLLLRKNIADARLALFNQQPEEALKILPAANDQQPDAIRIKIHELTATAYSLAGNMLESARQRVLLDPLLSDNEAINENHNKLWNSLIQLSTMALNQLRTEPPPDVFSGWMQLAAITKSSQLQPELFNILIDEWRLLYPQHPAEAEFLPTIISRQQQALQKPSAVALLLPLSGKLKNAAAAIRDGFLAAHFNHPDNLDTVIRIYDTEQDNTDITSIYRRAVAEGATFVIGPLKKDNLAVLRNSDKLEVPILALNVVDQANESVINNFFEFGLTPEDEARQAAERAAVEGLGKAVILVPEGEWGNRIFTAFSSRFLELGGEILEANYYQNSTNDFSRQISNLLNLNDSQQRYRNLKIITGKDIIFEPRRRQDVDFIFMAAFPRQARLIVPQIKFHHAADLPIYSTSHIYTGVANKKDNRDLNGIIFCDMPWTLTHGENNSTLYQNISTLWPQSMEEYSRLYALGIDAYDIPQYLEWLNNSPYERYSGATGSLSISNNRVKRTLQWARFIGGKAMIIKQPVIPETIEQEPGLQTIP
jgi:outer membrane PBP1 activator LpoA protein